MPEATREKYIVHVDLEIDKHGNGERTILHAPELVEITQPSFGTATLEPVDGEPRAARIVVEGAEPFTEQRVFVQHKEIPKGGPA